MCFHKKKIFKIIFPHKFYFYFVIPSGLIRFGDIFQSVFRRVRHRFPQDVRRGDGFCEKSAFFAALKKNGLRQIEDDLYEYKIRYKNCDTTEEALYIIRQINSRISILDDYLLSNPEISDYERDRWLDIIQKFKDLREEVGKKKVVSRKSYGLFVDYDKLDAMDF